MNTLSQKEITQLLQAWGGGDESALKDLVPMVRTELRRLGLASKRVLVQTANGDCR